jgi:hypothetical protein
MEPKFVISGIDGFDGEYPIDIGSFTMRELNIIKRVSGLRAGEIEDALKAGDSDLLVAIATLAVRREGKNWEQFELLAWESDSANFVLVVPEEDDADVPPSVLPPPLDEPGNSNESQTTSGDDSETPSESPEVTPLLTGMSGLDMPPTSDLRTLAN